MRTRTHPSCHLYNTVKAQALTEITPPLSPYECHGARPPARSEWWDVLPLPTRFLEPGWLTCININVLLNIILNAVKDSSRVPITEAVEASQYWCGWLAGWLVGVSRYQCGWLVGWLVDWLLGVSQYRCDWLVFLA